MAPLVVWYQRGVQRHTSEDDHACLYVKLTVSLGLALRATEVVITARALMPTVRINAAGSTILARVWIARIFLSCRCR